MKEMEKRESEKEKKYFWWGESYFHTGKDWRVRKWVFVHPELGASFDSAFWEGSGSLQTQSISVDTTLFAVMEFV